MQPQFEREVKAKIAEKPHLVALFGSVHDIPERLYEYSPQLFVAYNGKSEKFELHSLENVGDSVCAALPFDRLDVRTLHYVWENDIRVHGRAIFDRIEKGEQMRDYRQERGFKNWVEDVAKESRSAMAEVGWGVDGGKTTFAAGGAKP